MSSSFRTHSQPLVATLYAALVLLLAASTHAFITPMRMIPRRTTTATTQSIPSQSKIQQRRRRRQLLQQLSSSSNSAAESTKSSVIYADDSDFDFDPAIQSAVRLAKESALSMTGKVVVVVSSKTNNNNNKAEAKPSQFLRYHQVTGPLTQDEVTASMPGGARVLGVGAGQELYQDPGETETQAVIELAPMQAVQDLLPSIIPAAVEDGDDSRNWVVNVLGGDDLQVLEVMEALALLRQGMTTTNKVNLSFTTLTHSSFPLERVTMTLVSVPADASSNGLTGANKAIAEGRVFFQDGNYFTVVDEDLNTDLL